MKPEPQQVFVVNEPVGMCCGRPSCDCSCGRSESVTNDDALPLPPSTLSNEQEEEDDNPYPMID